VRREIKEALRVQLYEQMVGIVAEIIAPLYSAEATPNVAKHIAQDNELSAHLFNYLGRIAPRPSGPSMAVEWLSLTIAELDELLKGGRELISFDYKHGRVEFIDQSIADQLKIDLLALVADSEAS
jgi:hypothetical protein